MARGHHQLPLDLLRLDLRRALKVSHGLLVHLPAEHGESNEERVPSEAFRQRLEEPWEHMEEDSKASKGQ